MGMQRNRDLNTMVKENPNLEHHVELALAEAEAALAMETKRAKNVREILEAAEYCANLLEGAQMVAMWDLPTAHINAWRNMPENELDMWEIRAFLYDLMTKLKASCHILTL